MIRIIALQQAFAIPHSQKVQCFHPVWQHESRRGQIPAEQK
jgi:hypothetical protein